jgi:hypothetical protein
VDPALMPGNSVSGTLPNSRYPKPGAIRPSAASTACCRGRAGPVSPDPQDRRSLRNSPSGSSTIRHWLSKTMV